ncbi:MAG: Scr1 family TA system antitoxin-like transcriptional regulator [Pseudonocardiaceae bacterium]
MRRQTSHRPRSGSGDPPERSHALRRALADTTSSSRAFDHPGGINYHPVINETALRRRAAPAEVMAALPAQLVELSALPSVTLRVLPLTAQIAEFYVPHTSFSLYHLTDPEDPDIVVPETLTSDLHLGDDEDVSRYTNLDRWEPTDS